MKTRKPNKLFIQLSLFVYLCAPSLAQMQTPMVHHFMTDPSASMPTISHVHSNQSTNAGPSTITPTVHHHDQTAGSRSSLFHVYHHQQSQNVDLSSTADTAKGGHLLRNESVSINVGGNQLAVTSNTPLTESEKLAAMQVLLTGHQSLLLDAQGSADGGSLTIGSGLSSHISNLVIPTGVSVTDLSHSGNLNLSGNLIDSGSLNLIAAKPVVDNSSAFSILASNITVGSGGELTTSGNLNLITRSGDITNNGIISSGNGSINISAPKTSDINVNASGGTFQANNGNINFRDASYGGANNINLSGGNYLSQNLNLYSGTGNINGNVGQVLGNLNSYAGTEHFIANTNTLILGNNSITGDPLYANTGSIEIDGTINTSGNSLAVIAGGNIVSGTSGNVANIVTGAGKVWLVAGADITSSSGSTTSPITNGATSLTNVTFQFDSTQGGNIDFTPATAGTVISTTGGSVTLLANSNSSTTGNIWFPTSTISVSTINPSGGGGAVTVLAGGSGGTALSGAIAQAIQMGQIQTAGSASSATGNVQIATAAPSITNGGGSASFTNPSNSATTTATFGAGAITGTAQLTVGSVITVGYGGTGASGGVAGGAGGSINIQSGSTLQTGNLLSYGGGGEGGYFYGNSVGGNGGSAGSITVISHNGNLTVSGETNASGGGGGGGNGSNGGNGGSQANITLSAPVGSVTSGNVFSYAGGNGGAGALVDAGGGGGSFGGGGGGSGVYDNGGDGGAGGGAGAASGGGGGVGAGVGNFAPGNGGGFNGAGAGGAGTTASGSAGSASANLTYGSGHTGGSGGNSSASGGAPSGSGSTQLANGGSAGTDGDVDGSAAGSGHTTGGTLTVNYFSSQTIGTRVVATTNFNQTTTLTSLDLTNSTVQSEITNLITLGVYGIGGTYSNLTINAGVSSNAISLNSLTAFNVPSGDTLTLTSFTTGSPTIAIALTNTSTTTQAIIGGTVSFSNNNNSIGNISITSTQTGPAFLVNNTGTLSSDGQLSVQAPAIQNNGTVSAGSSITEISTNGSLYGTGTFRAPIISLTATGGDIGGDSGGATALLVNNGGAGLNLSANAAIVNLSDTQTEAVTLFSSTGTLAASSSFTLSTVGNIIGAASVIGTNGNTFTLSSYNGASSQTFTGSSFVSPGGNTINVVINGITYSYTFFSPISVGNSFTFASGPNSLVFINNTGATITSANGLVNALNTNFQNGSGLYPTPTIQSPVISLNSSGGNVGGNSSASTAMLVNNNGSGLLLYASGATVNLSDTASETVTLTGITSTTIAATTSFSLSTAGNIIESASVCRNKCSGIIFDNYNGTVGQTFGGSSFTNVSGTLTVLIGFSPYSYQFTGPIANGATMTFTNGSQSFVVTNNTGSALSSASVAATALNTYFQNGSSLYPSTTVLSPLVSLTNSSGNIGGNSSASTAFLVNNGGSGLTINARSTGTVNLSDAVSESVTLSGISTAGPTFTLKALGNIIGSGSIQSSSVVLTSINGGIGTNSTSVGIQTANVTFNAPDDVYLNDSLALTGNGISTGNNVSLTDSASGGITVSNSITAIGTLSLGDSGTDSPISVGAPLSGTIVTLTATGSGNITGSATVSGSTAVDIAAPTGTINLSGLATPSITTSQTTSGSGTVALTDSTALTGNGISTAGTGGFSLTDSASGGITTTNSITSGGALSLIDSGTNSPIAIGTGGLSGTAITLTATGSGNISGSATINGSTSVSLTSGTGSITSTMLVTPFITANTSGSGQVLLGDSLALTGNGVSTAGTGGFSLTDSASGGITTSSSITSGGSLSLDDAAVSSGITIGATLSAVSTMSLTATTNGNITGSSPVISTGLTLAAPTGSINLSNVQSTVIVTQQTVSGSGSVNLNSTINTPVTINPSSAGTGGFTLTAAGDINSVSTLLTDGNMSLTSSTNINANGGFNLSAASVTFTANNNININGIVAGLQNVFLDANGQIVNGTSGIVNATNGNVGFATTNGPGNLSVQNNGSVSANNGIVGFNGGSSGTIAITGTGTISGQTVNVGNLDPSTLQIQSPYTVVSPFTGNYTNTAGNISITQGSITGTLQVSGYTPPPSPTPSGGSTTVLTGLTPQQRLLYELNYLSLLQSLQQQANTKLFEQIGTKIATDYTPWTTYWRVPQFYPQPLQGGVSVNKTSQANSALFAASEFNANELTALSRAGVVFGSQSNNNFFDLQKGFVLFMPNKDIQVQTREGLVMIPKGAAAWVMETGNDVAIYDLHDTIHTGSVKVTVNKKEFTLAPGKELLLTRNQSAKFAELNPGNELGYRNVTSSNLGSGIKAYICDFSIAHGITNVPVINNLLLSHDSAHNKAARQMLRNAAILADLTGDDYSH